MLLALIGLVLFLETRLFYLILPLERNFLSDSLLATIVMLQWGTLTAQLMGQGRKMPVMDALIAATALQHKLTLVTRNVSDFANTALDLINPWDQ